MCTVSWLRGTDGASYELFFNRDERRTRLPAHPPRVYTHNNAAHYIAPTDGDSGGSWLAVNEYGLTLALLNLYQASDDCILRIADCGNVAAPDSVPQSAIANPKSKESSAVASKFIAGQQQDSFRSRGLLVTDLIGARVPEAISQKLRATDLRIYQPFTLLILSAEPVVTLCVWDGKELNCTTHGDEIMPLVSTSADCVADIFAARRAEFVRLKQLSPPFKNNPHFAFHRSHAPARDARSACMHRADAETVSFSWLQVKPHSINYLYHPRALCRRAVPTQVSLPRAVVKDSSTTSAANAAPIITVKSASSLSCL